MSTRTFRGARLVRFGEFELDVRAAELRKNGERVRIQEQPFRILSMLLERPGEAVLRDEMRRRLWPNDTVVEVGHGINAAVLRLREALGESAEAPRFIETLARRGYRFNGQVEVVYREAPAAPVRTPPPVLPGTGEDRVVSHYRILEKLGGGGMGVVYRAEDLVLGREVALKFLPPELAGDAAAVDRFRREARAASSLNHPNVCTIYGVEECDSQPVIVMELIEGETLAARLERGPLAADEAVRLAIQIAGALDAAHRRAVVHRDLKPSNLLVTRAGIKVLDFGLAKMDRTARETADAPQGPGITRYGAIMGTPSYMSPEQVRGGETDARSDIYSFGLVLYEMLTGRRALEDSAGTPEDREPHLAERFASPAVERIVRRCLARDAEDRWQSARDLKAELEWTVAPPVVEAPPVPRRQISWKAWAIVAATLVVLAVPWKGMPWDNGAPVTAPRPVGPVRMAITAPGEPSISRVAISPDGRKMAFHQGSILRVRDLESGKEEDIGSAVAGGSPFWAPNGRSLAFAGGGLLKRIELGTVNASVICPVNTNIGGAWGADGSILIGMIGDGIYRVPAGGGAPARLTDVSKERQETRHLAPQFLPDGKHFLYIAASDSPGRSQAVVARLDAPGQTPILTVSSNVEFVPSRRDARRGFLLFLMNGTLAAQGIDTGAMKLIGSPILIAGAVSATRAMGAAVDLGDFSATADVLAYRPANRNGGPAVVVMRKWMPELK